MNKVKQPVFSILIVFLVFGCQESVEYKYDTKPMMVTCGGADKELLNEALYSFFNDISVYYASRVQRPMSSTEAYANFIYKGSKGDADFRNIVSKHSLKLLEKLKQDEQLWDYTSNSSNLNYDSEFVSCLFSNIEDSSMRTTIMALKTTGSLNPKLLSDRLITNVVDDFDQPNFLMYIALDTYYQYLMDLDLSEINSNE